MSPVLQALEPDAVVAALEANLYALYRFIGGKGGRPLGDDGDVSWVNASPSWPRFLFDPRFDGSDAGRRLREIGERIEKGELPNVLQVGPRCQPENLRFVLRDAGFQRLQVDRPGMALELTGAPLNEESPGELSVLPVRKGTEVRAWATLDSGTDVDLYLRLVSDGQLKLYLGTLDDVPVARSMVFYASGVAGLYLVSVLEPYRNRGFGTAMTVQPLLDARADGYKVSVLFATDLGRGVYTRIGFEKLMELEYYGWGG